MLHQRPEWFISRCLITLIITSIISVQLYAAEFNRHSYDDMLDMSLQDLMSIEIFTAGKINEKIKDIPASVYIINRSDIEKYGYQTLTQIIQNIPGVYNIYNYNGVSGNYGARGFWNPKSQNSSIAILINGVKQLSVSDSDRSHPLERINVLPESIDRIEFIKGPMGVMYGNGASFGVLNIITNEQDESFVSVSTGSNNTGKVVLRYAEGNDKRNIVFNASTYKADGLNNALSDMMSSVGEAVLTNAGVPLPPSDYTTEKLLEQQSHYLNASGVYDEWYFDLSYNQADVEAVFLVPPVDDGDVRNVDVFTTMLGYKNEVNAEFAYNARLVFNDYQQKRDFDGIVSGIIADAKIDYKSYEFEFLTTYSPDESLKIVTGVNIEKTSDFNEFTHVPLRGIDNELVKFDRTVKAVFSQANYKISDELLLVAGLRYEVLERYTRTFIDQLGQVGESSNLIELGNISTTTPRLSAVYAFNDSHTLKLMYGRSIRLSDDEFDAEETETYEFNYLYMKHDVYASVSLFHNKLENLLLDIIFLSGGGIDGQRSSQGEISTDGVEVVVKKYFADNFETELGFTIQESVDNSSNAEIDASYSPDTLFHLKSAYTYVDTVYSITGRFTDSMLSFLKRTPTDPQGTYIGQEAKSNMVWDLNIRFNDIQPNLDASIGVQNVFDEEIRYPNNIENTEFMDLGSIGHGRVLMGALGWRF